MIAFTLLFLAAMPPSAADTGRSAWEARARQVTITRDTWGIPHVRGRTDADVVFGLMYAQAEDDFSRIETNYLNAMGRLAEAEGEAAIWSDLRMRLFIHPDSLQARYRESPAWLRALMDAWADGLNYFLATRTDVRPRVITRFEPWMALSFTEGSIGGDIETISLASLQRFYGGGSGAATDLVQASPREPTGSNGFAIAPRNTATGHAMLLINPHTTFFFRAVAQVTSDEGLNAYGALTWGQFFVYQGFNPRLGWMHTSSGNDAIDEYAETIVRRGDQPSYRYGGAERPVTVERITVPYRTPGGMAERTFTVYRTHHGPVIREVDGKWITVRLWQDPVKALMQSYGRTKARSLAAFREVMDLHANTSNNTVYADADGNIAYFHANVVPRRSLAFRWDQPVDGSDPATEWQGLHTLEESPNVINPGVGWIQNTNNWPYSAAGPDSPKAADYPPYFDDSGENPRGVNAVRVLTGRRNLTLDSLMALAYDPYLTAFAELVPPVVRAWGQLAPDARLKGRLDGPVATLRGWDFRWGVASEATSLAVAWGEEMWRRVARDAVRQGLTVYDYLGTRTADSVRLAGLAAAVDTLVARHGRWQVAWGEINRFQRLTGDLQQPFDDAKPSLPVGFTSAQWGSLASFGTRTPPGTVKRYGTTGNSFVAVVEFGPRVQARAVTAGGQSGHPASPHFNDQAAAYAAGDLQPVFFHQDEIDAHTARRYHPGQ